MATLAACLAAALVPTAGLAATPAQEQAFVDTYRKAFEGRDAKTLHSLMYTEGADPKALGFYRMMTTVGMGSKVASIALVDLTAEDRARADRTMPSPDGRSVKLSLRPVKKLVIRKTTKDASGSSSSTSRCSSPSPGGNS